MLAARDLHYAGVSPAEREGDNSEGFEDVRLKTQVEAII